jgi:ferritin-like metal-binding protein YciE
LADATSLNIAHALIAWRCELVHERPVDGDMESNEQLIAWLQDAHAMEQSLEQVLTRHSAAAAEHPEVQQRLEEHLDETRRHREHVAECLETLGASPSTIKSAAGGFMGAMQGMSTGVFQDELIKNALADYAMEHFEIGCYMSLIAAAEEAGHQQIARTCGEILREEVKMAGWLEDQIPQLTRNHLHPSAA